MMVYRRAARIWDCGMMVIAERFCAGYYFLNQLIIGYAKYLSCSRLVCQCMLQICEILVITICE